MFQIAVSLLVVLLPCSDAWASVPAARLTPSLSSSSRRQPHRRYNMIPEAATSLIAGSVAGALGVGVAFPLDTIKTFQQVKMEDRSRIEYFVSPTGEVSIARSRDNSNQLLQTIHEIYQTKGLGGFYGGVSTSMLGQAVIKATAFSVNAAVLQQHHGDLLLAAATAGFVTAFLSSPVDRIKVLMQTGTYPSELSCIQTVLQQEGLQSFMTTGLIPTIFREVPAYTLYFYLYGSLMASDVWSSTDWSAVAPAISGALAGAACVVPVHPVDCVKTIVQHTATEWQTVCQDIYDRQGFEGFWEGLAPRMSRAAVNHGATFAIYDVLVNQLHKI